MDINSSTKKHPKQVIREYLDEPEEETSFFDGVTENLTKLLDGISFSIGLTRFRTWLMILLTVLSTYACRSARLPDVLIFFALLGWVDDHISTFPDCRLCSRFTAR
eukprot:3012924-Rhodomonas_salina.2